MLFKPETNQNHRKKEWLKLTKINDQIEIEMVEGYLYHDEMK